MGIILLDIVLVIVIVFVLRYYYSYMGKNAETNKEHQKCGVIVPAVLGGILTFSVMFIFRETISSDASSLILMATTVLAVVICVCAGWIVKTIKSQC